MEKEFFDHFSGIKVANDGEVWVPQSGTRPEHFTYGSLTRGSHRRVSYHRFFYSVHVLVAEVFLNNNQPIDGKKFHVHHINGNAEDNRVENLLILTIEEHNRLHHTGEKASWYGKCGTLHPRSKPIIGVNKTTGEEVKFSCAAEAKRILGIFSKHICDCCKGKIKSSCGYVWKYA